MMSELEAAAALLQAALVWYAIVSSGDPDALVVDGPYKDNEHWISEIPSRYHGAKVIGSDDDEENG